MHDDRSVRRAWRSAVEAHERAIELHERAAETFARYGRSDAAQRELVLAHEQREDRDSALREHPEWAEVQSFQPGGGP